MADRPVCVVLVVDHLGYGGAERQVIELANNMDRSRFDVHVCALSDHVPFADRLIDAQRRLHTIRKAHRWDFTVVPRLAHLLNELQADIVHGFLFSAEISSRLAGRLANTKLIVGSERNANRVIQRRHALAYKLTQTCVDAIIANSHAGAESNRRIFNRSALDYRVVYNGIDSERFRPMDPREMRRGLAVPAHGPVIGAFANFKRQKNHAMLFRAFRRFITSFPQARLLLVGEQPVDTRGKSSGYRARMDRLVDDLGIRHRCVFLGHRNDVEHLYPACDITVLSSLHEGTPNVLLESMSCGVPVVATNVCDNEYIVQDGSVGCLVAVDDDTAMAHRMGWLLRDDALRRQMGRNARQWVLNEFSNKRLTDRMEAIYLDLFRQEQGSCHVLGNATESRRRSRLWRGPRC